MKIGKTSWILLAILILGTSLRLYNLGRESFWYDEIGSIDQAVKALPILFTKFDVSPLYAFFLKYWMRLFGVSEASLRFPSVIFGIGAIFLLYKVGNILFNEKIALTGSLIMAISPFHIFYSQEARNYMLFLFLTLSSISFFLKMTREQSGPGRRSYLYYTAATMLLLYTHQFGIFVVLLQNLFVFLRKIKERRAWMATQAIILIIYLPWLIPNLIYVIDQREFVMACNHWITKPNLLSLANLFKTFSYGGINYGGHDYPVHPARVGLSVILAYLFGIFSVLGLFSSRKEDSGSLFFLGLWLFIPITAAFILSYLLFPLFVGRYLIFAFPAYCLLVARGIDKLKVRLYWAGAVFLIVIFTVPSLQFYYKQDLKIRWNDAFDFVDKNKKTGDIFIIAPARHIQMFAYQDIKGNPRHNRLRLNIRADLGVKLHRGGFIYYFRGHDIAGVEDAAQLERMVEEKAIKEGENIWLLISRWASPGRGEEIKKYLESFNKKVKDKQYEGIEVVYYHTPKTADAIE